MCSARTSHGEMHEYTSSVRLDPCRLLINLAAGLERETEELTFDYYTLHRLC